jgi:hypothetical protein
MSVFDDVKTLKITNCAVFCESRWKKDTLKNESHAMIKQLLCNWNEGKSKINNGKG